MQADIVMKNCKIVNHDGISNSGLAIKEGKIAAIAADEYLPEARSTIDAGGNYVLPGIIDAHCHVGWLARHQTQFLRGRASIEVRLLRQNYRLPRLCCAHER